MKPKPRIIHDDGCGALLDPNGYCSKCGFHPDMQSTRFATPEEVTLGYAIKAPTKNGKPISATDVEILQNEISAALHDARISVQDHSDNDCTIYQELKRLVKALDAMTIYENRFLVIETELAGNPAADKLREAILELEKESGMTLLACIHHVLRVWKIHRGG